MDDDAPPGVPEWVVTYGDMMSLLLTFFIMLVSLSEVVADQKFRAVLESLRQKFGYRHGPAAPPGINFPLNAMLANLDSLGSFTDDERGHGGVSTPSVPGENSRSVRGREGDGLRVGVPIDFDAGSEVPRAGFEPIVETIRARIAGIPNKVELRGVCRHDERAAATDRVAERHARTSLAYRRARAVRDRLVALGLEPDRLRLVVEGDGGGDGDLDGWLHAPDRVDVYVLDVELDEFVGPRDGD